jgi:aminoglycoside 3-N-acetyltransferase
MPALSHIAPDFRFYMDKTPSRVGLVTEVFRVSEGVKRSKHPTHSICAWGARADELLAGHENTSGAGVGSPLHKAAEAGADVLMIGCDLRTCTLVHVSEAIVRVPYLGVVSYKGYDKAVTLVDYDGTETLFPPKDLPGDGNGFVSVQKALQERGMIHECKFGSALCLKFPAKECLGIAVEMLKKDPAAVLCSSPRCSVCPPSREVIKKAKQEG